MWESVISYNSGYKLSKINNNNVEEYHSNKTKSRTKQQRYHHNCFVYLPKLHQLSSLSSLASLKSSSSSSSNYGPPPEQNNLPHFQQSQNKGLWKKWREKSGETSSKLAKLGLSAVLAYGLFDAVTYTSFFVLAFLGYEKRTGQNPAANLKALIGIIILMWTGNNVTRPFRVAGAAALAPFIDKGLKQIQKYFKFPSLFNAFALVVGIVAAPCLAVVGLLILSRLGK